MKIVTVPTCAICLRQIQNEETHYDCDKCPNFMLCEKCFSSHQTKGNHQRDHLMKIFRQGSPWFFTCGACQININGQRWRCLVCSNFDLCSSCMHRNKWPATHLGVHPINSFHDYLDKHKKVNLTQASASSFGCDVCHKAIEGLRVHCNNCMNYNLCRSCYECKKASGHHSYTHIVSAFLEPGSIPLPGLSTSHVRTKDVGLRSNVQLKKLTTVNADYNRIKEHFMSTWEKDLHKKATIRIQSIYTIHNEALSGFYSVYQDKLIQNNIAPNEKHLWHGTSADCDINKSSTLCQSAKCAMCNITRSNFETSRAQSNISFGRFGNGLYFSPCSSKSHDYNAKSEKNGVRSMLLCKVQLGKSYSTKTDMQDLRGPPEGYNSLSGEVGSRLNFPEVVVWDERAILPSYMVFYSGF